MTRSREARSTVAIAVAAARIIAPAISFGVRRILRPRVAVVINEEAVEAALRAAEDYLLRRIDESGTR
jgi:hypothetical protein